MQSVLAKLAEYKEKIGLDFTASDFNPQKINAKVMGERLANLIDH